MFVSPFAFGVACLRPEWRKKWAPTLAGVFLFCFTATLVPGRVNNRQIRHGEGQIQKALEAYKDEHGRYPTTLGGVSDPLVAQEKIRIGWELRPIRYQPSPDGSEYRVQFECPAFVVATYDSREPGWTHDD